jgi:hypothetical protein
MSTAFTYDLTNANREYQYSPIWFAVVVRWAHPASFDRSSAGFEKGKAGKNVSVEVDAREELPPIVISNDILRFRN